MSEIEKMQRYIERTKMGKMGKSDRFALTTPDAVELAHEARAMADFPIEVIDLAFTYGKAKGYRAAKAEGRARA